MKNIFVVFLFALFSCSVNKDDVFYDSVRTAQLEFNPEGISQSSLIKLHENRRQEFLKKRHNFKVRNGYIFILDQFGGGYSQFSGIGNIWSKQDNIYYTFSSYTSKFEIIDNPKLRSAWSLFKRAVEEWDLDQINKYYEISGSEGFGKYIASKVEVKNNKVVNIQTYVWHD